MPSADYPSRSVEIQEIIGQIPPWTIRWGITVLFLVFVILLACSHYIRYPDVLPAGVTIGAREQPFRISWYRDGPQTHKVCVREGRHVAPGDTLVVERNLADGSATPVLSPVAGRVIFLKGSEDNPRKSTIIVYPRLSGFEVQAYLSAKGSGKVRAGQKVLISLDAFPAEDYGMLEGKVLSVLPFPIGDKYRAEIQLTDGLVTTENKKIPPRHLMTGNAEIVLEDRNLLGRIFGSLLR